MVQVIFLQVSSCAQPCCHHRAWACESWTERQAEFHVSGLPDISHYMVSQDIQPFIRRRAVYTVKCITWHQTSPKEWNLHAVWAKRHQIAMSQIPLIKVEKFTDFIFHFCHVIFGFACLTAACPFQVVVKSSLWSTEQLLLRHWNIWGVSHFAGIRF